ncbi:MAG: hypothetical protein ACREPX_06500 [Rhodanobacteraceae bacterium]
MKIRTLIHRVPATRSALGIASALALSTLSPPSFALAPGEDGAHVTIPVSGLPDIAYAVAVDPDGGIVLAGGSGTTSSALVRLTRSGGIDGAFGSGGIAINDLAAGQGDFLYALVRTDDGHYVGCGTAFASTTGADFVVARFNANGSLDMSFDGVGYAATPFSVSGSGGSLFDQCNAVAVQSDGMIVSAGLTYETGPSTVALTRHTMSGALDSGFGSGGKVDINASSSAGGNSEARAVLVLPDGKILVAGFAYNSGHGALMVMRLQSDGTPDSTFGSAGITRTSVGTSEDIANAIVRLPDGRFVVAGSSIFTDNRRDFVLARYAENGVLDPTFGSGGIVTTPVGPGDDRAYAISRMPWGRLIVAGSARISTSAAGTDFAVVAYNADGTLDRYFGDAGIRTINLSDFDDVAYGIAPDIDGQHFWAVGTGSPDATQDFTAVELGLPDTIFRHGFDTTTAP